jgi:hypothetical protein
MPQLKRKGIDQLKQQKAKSMRTGRTDEKRRLCEKKNNKEAMRTARLDEERRLAENENNKEAMRTARLDEERRLAENKNNKEAMRIVRLDEQRRLAENENNKKAMRIARLDEQRRLAENENSKEAMKIVRLDEGRHAKENELKKATHAKRQSDFDNLLREYNSNIREGPTYVCSSCGGLWYRTSVCKGDIEKFHAKGCDDGIISQIFNCNGNKQKGHFFCSTCWKSVNRTIPKIPKLCLTNGFSFPMIPPQLADLTPLEERLVSLRLPFCQIRSLGADRQFGMKGNIVNVMNDLDTTAKVS